MRMVHNVVTLLFVVTYYNNIVPAQRCKTDDNEFYTITNIPLLSTTIKNGETGNADPIQFVHHYQVLVVQ